MNKQGKHIFIVGGSGRVGFSIAKKLYNGNNMVSLAARDIEKLFDCKNILGENCQCYCFDVTWEENKILEQFREAENKCGAIDVLVYAVGDHGSKPFIASSYESFDKSISVELKGCYFVCKCFVGYMNGRSGEIIIINSISSFQEAITSGQISKWGLRGLTEGLGGYCAQKNIYVYGLAPGHILPDCENMVEKQMLDLITEMIEMPINFLAGKTYRIE